MSEMIWELFVTGLLLYGLALLGFAALSRPATTLRGRWLDEHEAPIFVRRRGMPASKMAPRTQTSRRAS